MGIIEVPEGVQLEEPVPCVMCPKRRPPHAMTAGQLDYRGNQGLACDSHFHSTNELILGWADFEARQRDLMLSHDEGEYGSHI